MLGGAVGTVVPGIGNAVGGAVGGIIGCLGPGAVAAWTGQGTPALPPLRGTTTQAALLAGDAPGLPGSPTSPSAGVQFRASGTASPATPSTLPLLLLGVLVAAVVAWSLSRRRRR